MKQPMPETVKNFLICAALMLICGVCAIIALKKTSMGMICIGIGVVFAVMAFTVGAKEADKTEAAKKKDSTSGKKGKQE